jgi:alpha-glucoside transport system substrate-binding protein
MKFVKAAVAVSSMTLLAGMTTVAANAAAAGPKSIMGGKILCKNQYKGKKVRIFSPIRGEDVKLFESSYVAFEKCTGADLIWEGSEKFETEIKVRVNGGNAPDVANFPQPGLMANLAAQGKVKPLPKDMADSIGNDYIPGWKELATSTDGKSIIGLPLGANVKSFVWYSPKAFTAKGYAVPKSLEDLGKLSDKIVADGGTPWCAGIESGDATGWVVTDWLEDMMLRLNGPEVYDQWVSHKIAFNDPRVKTAMDAVGGYLKNPKYMGSENAVKAIATTKFQDGGLPILDGKCFMHRQASFYSGIWPKGTVLGPDGVDAFYLPQKAGGKKVMLGGGELNSAMNTKKETFDVIRYLASAEYASARAKAGNWFSPRKDFNTADMPDQYLAKFSKELSSSEVFRFDGSDLMPGAVGAGTFWKESTNWITGQSTDDTLKKIEDSWPKA